jgi:uncharacterized protein (TIGR02271 family)
MDNHQSTGQRHSKHDAKRLAGLEDWQLQDSRQDLRGHVLVNLGGHPVGKISDMLVNLDEERVVAVRLDNGEVVDIDQIDLRDGKVVLLDASGTDPAHGHAGSTTGSSDAKKVPIVEETLEVGKRVTDLHNVSVRTRVVERPVSENVTLKREHVQLERRPADQTLTSAEADSLLRDGVIEVTERGEEVVVGKTARVVEEVVVHKDVGSHEERVEGTVRHTEVEVDRDGSPDRRDSRKP